MSSTHMVEEATQNGPLRVYQQQQIKFPIPAMTQLAVTYLRTSQQQLQQSQPKQQHHYRCRDIIDALASILKAVADQKNQGAYRQTIKRGEYGGALVTRIKNQAKVTSRQLKRYLRMLSAYGLIKIQYKLKKNVVRLTDKGSEYLQMYRKVHDLLLF